MEIDNDGYLFGEPDHEVMSDYQAYLVLIGFISESNTSDKEKFMVSQAVHQLYYKLKKIEQGG